MLKKYVGYLVGRYANKICKKCMQFYSNDFFKMMYNIILYDRVTAKSFVTLIFTASSRG